MADIKPALMRFEGPMYSDGSGPQVCVEYQGPEKSPFAAELVNETTGKKDTVACVRIEGIGSEDVAVLMPNVPWLIETLQRICREAE